MAEDRTAALADIATRLAEKRAEIAASPLGRYRGGRDSARAAMQAALDDLTCRRMATLLRAALDDDADRASESLAELDPDEAAVIANAAETLAKVAWGAVRGRR